MQTPHYLLRSFIAMPKNLLEGILIDFKIQIVFVHGIRVVDGMRNSAGHFRIAAPPRVVDSHSSSNVRLSVYNRIN